jgi:hypothetical protein
MHQMEQIARRDEDPESSSEVNLGGLEKEPNEAANNRRKGIRPMVRFVIYERNHNPRNAEKTRKNTERNAPDARRADVGLHLALNPVRRYAAVCRESHQNPGTSQNCRH